MEHSIPMDQKVTIGQQVLEKKQYCIYRENRELNNSENNRESSYSSLKCKSQQTSGKRCDWVLESECVCVGWRGGVLADQG